MSDFFDCLVVGTGPVGMVAARGLAQAGISVGLIGPEPNLSRDGRTVAILDKGVSLLQSLGMWDAAQKNSAALTEMRIIDDTGSLFRAPPVTFRAHELGLEAFGQNIELTDLVTHLSKCLETQTTIHRLSNTVKQFSRKADGVIEVELTSGHKVKCRILIGADGKNSQVRDFAEIKTKKWDYPQSALTALFSHERDHEDRSTEFHKRSGPFTLKKIH